jgi:hypothetical protein
MVVASGVFSWMACPKKGCKGTVSYRFNVPTCSEHGPIPTVPKMAPASEKPAPKPKRKTQGARE